MSAITLTEDDALRLAEAGLSGDYERFLTELRSAGMPPFLVSLAKNRHPAGEWVSSLKEDWHDESYEAGKEDGYELAELDAGAAAEKNLIDSLPEALAEQVRDALNERAA